eukprot:1151888-Pleurochrysis_carterae.AAC.1
MRRAEARQKKRMPAREPAYAAGGVVPARRSDCVRKRVGVGVHTRACTRVESASDACARFACTECRRAGQHRRGDGRNGREAGQRWACDFFPAGRPQRGRRAGCAE